MKDKTKETLRKFEAQNKARLEREAVEKEYGIHFKLKPHNYLFLELDGISIFEGTAKELSSKLAELRAYRFNDD